MSSLIYSVDEATSTGLQDVLPARATKLHAVEFLMKQQGTTAAFYLARGEFLGMNGNYSAGIIEGVAHYHPRARLWMEQDYEQ